MTEFAELAGSTFIKALTDPEYLKLLSDAEKSMAFQDMTSLVPYDYFGNRSDVLERLTWVGLVDAVYNGNRTRELIGMEAIEQSLARNAPSFLGYNKDITTIGPGDWLSWQTGLSEPGRVYFAVFGLPMEGLASWGLVGMIIYPFLFMLPLRTPVELAACCACQYLPIRDIQHRMIESTSDVILAWMRGICRSFFLFFLPCITCSARGRLFPARVPFR